MLPFSRKKSGDEEGMKQKNVFLSGLLFLCFFLPVLFSMTGCWDRREPGLLGVVMAVAYDYDPQTGLLHLIAQVANPSGISSGEGGGQSGGSSKSTFWVVETSGHTIYEAVKKTEQVSTRKLIWSHIEVVLFSEAIARKGLRPVLDYIDRERQVRLVARPFVVQGDIRQLLEAEFPLEQLGGLGIARQLSTIRMEEAFTSDIDTFRKLFHNLSMPGMELILPRIEVLAEGEEVGRKSNDGGSNGKKDSGDAEVKTGAANPVKISGAALFRGDRLVGYFDEKETAGYLWLTRNVRRLTMVFPPPWEKDKYLTVEVFRTFTKLEPQVQGDNVRLNLYINSKGRLQDFAGVSLPKDEAFKSSLNRCMVAVIRDQIGAAWQKACKLNLDVFGFGYALYQAKPRDWKRLEEKWAEIFPEIDLQVDVEAKIRNYGLVVDPIKIR